MIRTTLIVIALALFMMGCTDKPTTKPSELPNIIVLTAENLSLEQVENQKSLNNLRKSSVLFEHAYLLGPEKGPNLAALLSGRIPAGFAYTSDRVCEGTPMATDSTSQGLDQMVTTLPELVAADNYRSAFFGRWAISRSSQFPTAYGFDEDSYNSQYRVTNQGIETIAANALDVFPPYGSPISPNKIMEQCRDFLWRLEGQKFLLQINLDTDDCLGKPADALALDSIVGMLRSALDTMGQLENTLIILTSTQVDNNTLTASDKARLLSEGHLKVPFLVSWPAVGTRNKHAQWRVALSDVLPTVSAIFEMPRVRTEGASLLPLLLRQDSGFLRQPIVFHYPYMRNGAMACSGMLVGDHKIIEYLDGSHLEYFNLGDDPLEENNLLRSNTQDALELIEELNYNRRVLGVEEGKLIK